MVWVYVGVGIALWVLVCIVVERIWAVDAAEFTGKALGVVMVTVVFGSMLLSAVAFIVGWDPLGFKDAPAEVVDPGSKPDDCNVVVSGPRSC